MFEGSGPPGEEDKESDEDGSERVEVPDQTGAEDRHE